MTAPVTWRQVAAELLLPDRTTGRWQRLSLDQRVVETVVPLPFRAAGAVVLAAVVFGGEVADRFERMPHPGVVRELCGLRLRQVPRCNPSRERNR